MDIMAKLEERWNGLDYPFLIHTEGELKFSDIASLPLLFMLMHLFLNIISPIQMGFSRYHEHEADRFSLEIRQNNHAAAMSFVKLQEENLAIPRPGWLYKFWRSSHPSLGDRIDFCNNYRPWEEGKPLKYESLFRKENMGKAKRYSKIINGISYDVEEVSLPVLAEDNIRDEEIVELEGLFRHIYMKDANANALNVQRRFKQIRYVRKNDMTTWEN